MSRLKKAVKRIGKRVKKVVKKVGKVIKKVAKPLAIAAAIYFTGGAALGAMGSSWGALGSSIMSGVGSAGSMLKTGAKWLGKKMLGSQAMGMLGGSAGDMGGEGVYDAAGNVIQGGGGFDWAGAGKGLAQAFMGGSKQEGLAAGLYNADGSFNWGNALKAGVDAYGSYQGGKNIQSAFNKAGKEANPFASQRGFYAKKLRDLEQNPDSIANTPGYKFAQSQGEQAIGRLASATGGRLGGKRMTDVLKFNNNLSRQMFAETTSRYATLAGSQMQGGGQFYGAGAQAYAGGMQDATGTLGYATA